MIPPDPLIGYLAHFVTSDQNHYFGGILTTDLRGIPKEFKHTEAVKPSRTQTILYGDTLELAIGTDAIAPALYASLSRKPNLLLIEKNGKPLFGSFLLEHSPSGLIVSLKSPDLAFGEYLANEGNLINALDFDLKNSSTDRHRASASEVDAIGFCAAA